MSADGEAAQSPIVFTRESATEIIRKEIDGVLGEESYRSAEVGEWMRILSKNILERLLSLSDQYKFMSTIEHDDLMVNLTISQKKQPQIGIHSNTSAIYDSSVDQSFMVRWEGKYMTAIVAVFAVQL